MRAPPDRAASNARLAGALLLLFALLSIPFFACAATLPRYSQRVLDPVTIPNLARKPVVSRTLSVNGNGSRLPKRLGPVGPHCLVPPFLIYGSLSTGPPTKYHVRSAGAQDVDIAGYSLSRVTSFAGPRQRQGATAIPIGKQGGIKLPKLWNLGDEDDELEDADRQADSPMATSTASPTAPSSAPPTTTTKMQNSTKRDLTEPNPSTTPLTPETASTSPSPQTAPDDGDSNGDGSGTSPSPESPSPRSVPEASAMPSASPSLNPSPTSVSPTPLDSRNTNATTTVTVIPPTSDMREGISTSTSTTTVALSTVAPRLGQGSSCNEDEQCRSNLACEKGTCEMPGRLGGACERERDCLDGFACVRGVCTVGSGNAAEGAQCRADQDCMAGLICRDDQCLRTGEVDDGIGGQGDECNADAECKLEFVCLRAQCSEKSALGGFCKTTADCASGVCAGGNECLDPEAEAAEKTAIDSDEGRGGTATTEVNVAAVAGGVSAAVLAIAVVGGIVFVGARRKRDEAVWEEGGGSWRGSRGPRTGSRISNTGWVGGGDVYRSENASMTVWQAAELNLSGSSRASQVMSTGASGFGGGSSVEAVVCQPSDPMLDGALSASYPPQAASGELGGGSWGGYLVLNGNAPGFEPNVDSNVYMSGLDMPQIPPTLSQNSVADVLSYSQAGGSEQI